MDLLATLRRSGGLEAIARQTDVSSATVMAAAETLLPFLMSGLRAIVVAGGGGATGVAALLRRIEGFGDGNLAAELMGPARVETEPFERLTEQLVPGPGGWRALSEDCAIALHLERGVAERILQLLAMLLCGYISARAGGSGVPQSDAIAALGPVYDVLVAGNHSGDASIARLPI